MVNTYIYQVTFNCVSRTLQTDTGSACWQQFKYRFNEVVRDVIRFAKKIPGFTNLVLEDQISLIKGGCFEVWHSIFFRNIAWVYIVFKIYMRHATNQLTNTNFYHMY